MKYLKPFYQKIENAISVNNVFYDSYPIFQRDTTLRHGLFTEEIETPKGTYLVRSYSPCFTQKDDKGECYYLVTYNKIKSSLQ